MAAPKYARIFALGEEKVLVINNMLAEGASAQVVARHIQGVWGEFGDVAEKTLMQQLLRYRSEFCESPKVQQELAVDPKTERFRKVEGKLDVMAEMIDLAMKQKQRLTTFLARESELKMPIKGVSEDISLLNGMLKDIQKVQFDLGLDQYQGPLIQGGRVTQSRTVHPDGTVVEEQTSEVVSSTLEVLEAFRQRKQQPPAIEGEASVVPVDSTGKQP
ncbi:hypothetical protein DLP3_105 [Stenotrophomonas phage vB_SmaS_DLP_3]|nr:hypothetical protein DLP3_105 [Stenotrophomonas phage vB_SmaS_DLP_3]